MPSWQGYLLAGMLGTRNEHIPHYVRDLLWEGFVEGHKSGLSVAK